MPSAPQASHAAWHEVPCAAARGSLLLSAPLLLRPHRWLSRSAPPKPPAAASRRRAARAPLPHPTPRRSRRAPT
eukprot:5263772-Prymnesium_polylepis.1